MAMTLVSQASSRFESRFVLNALIPTAVFLPLSVAIAGQSIWGVARLLDNYIALPTALQLAVPVAAVSGIWLVASVVASQWQFIVRVFEGYPLLRLWSWMHRNSTLRYIEERLMIPGTLGHARRKWALESRMAEGQLPDTALHLNYDTSDPAVLPTSLGNILHAAEMYPDDRYGIDVTVFWTRLAMLMPEHVLSEIETLTKRYQLPLVIAAWGVALSGTSVVPAIFGNRWLFSETLAAGAALCYFGYIMSLRSARDYGVALRAAFDVHRNLLVEHWPPLESIKDDRARFSSLREFVLSGKLIETEAWGPLMAVGAATQNVALEEDGKPEMKKFGWPYLLRTHIIFALFILWGLGNAAIWLHRNDYLVTGTNVSAYSEVSGTIQQKRLQYRRLPDPALPLDTKNKTIVVTQSIKADSVLTLKNVVALNFVPAGFIHLPMGSAEARQLGIASGTGIEVVFSGPADFKSDTACRKAQESGAPRVVSGAVVSIVDVNPTQRSIVVGFPGSAATSVTCYGSSQASISRSSAGDSADGVLIGRNGS